MKKQSKKFGIMEEKPNQKDLKKLFFLAYHDALTGLENRASFEEKLEKILFDAQQKDFKVAILFIDMDHFKYFNDFLGYLAGDKLLKLVAKHLRAVIPSKYFLFRIGGDEFVLIIPKISSLKLVERVARKILTSFKKPFFIEEQKIFVETSIGISVYPEDAESAQSMLKHADSALKRAKAIGGNNYQFCSLDILAQEKRLVKIEGKVRAAIISNDFLVYYQPIFSLKKKQILGFEALLRWYSDGEILTTEDFFQIAEKKGLVIPLGKKILKKVCMLSSCLRARFPGLSLKMNINISPKQFRKEANFFTVVKRIFKEAQINPGEISFEITENSLMQDIQDAVILMQKLKKLGIGIAIDDFGVGYSSLNYIKYFSAQVLKIDKSFIKDLNNTVSCSIVQHIVSMAHSLGMQVVAEGIETKEQYAFLRRAKVDMGQGYFLGRPISEEEVMVFLETRHMASI